MFESAAADMAPAPGAACASCARDVHRVPAADLGVALVTVGRAWDEFLRRTLARPGGGDALRSTPQPDVWSAIEYACHVRDLLAMTARRLELTIMSSMPALPRWDPLVAAREGHYREQDPTAVAEDILVEATELGRLVQRSGPRELHRQARWDGRPVTAGDLARHGLHEAEHHLGDARGVVPLPTLGR